MKVGATARDKLLANPHDGFRPVVERPLDVGAALERHWFVRTVWLTHRSSPVRHGRHLATAP